MKKTDVTPLMNAFHYARNKTYPEACNKNDKRIIRRKAEKLTVEDGDLLYKKREGKKSHDRNEKNLYIIVLVTYVTVKS